MLMVLGHRNLIDQNIAKELKDHRDRDLWDSVLLLREIVLELVTELIVSLVLLN